MWIPTLHCTSGLLSGCNDGVGSGNEFQIEGELGNVSVTAYGTVFTNQLVAAANSSGLRYLEGAFNVVDEAVSKCEKVARLCEALKPLGEKIGVKRVVFGAGWVLRVGVVGGLGGGVCDGDLGASKLTLCKHDISLTCLKQYGGIPTERLLEMTGLHWKFPWTFGQVVQLLQLDFGSQN